MKNRLQHLNDHLFAQIERLSDEDMSAEKLKDEIARADALVGLSDQVLAIAALQLKATALVAEHGIAAPAILQVEAKPNG